MPEPTPKRTYRFFNTKIHQFGERLRHVYLPGFQKVPLYDVFWFFIRGVQKGALNTRASSIAFNFMLAFGPGIIFLFALIPYLPIVHFKEELLEVLTRIIPENSYIAIEPLIDEIFNRKGGGWPLFGLLGSIFFAQKGVNGIIDAFNGTYHDIETRPWYIQRLVAVGFVFIFYGLILFATLLMFFSKSMLEGLIESGHLDWGITFQVFRIGKWTIIFFLTFYLISLLYYLAPQRKNHWRLFSAGSSLATVLTVLTSLGFSYFVNNFAQFNKFFGSIGALVAFMLWFNFIALTLLIGFELNASIKNATIQSGEQ
ncbi:MAG: YihY/virulence factor BrkB family protein [Bacteroidales bacterium]|nr:YihY/virulence factor BrkB family protein [Bacteroidales bacterium]